MTSTKIIATLGPASSNMRALRAMMTAGMDVARLNFSHASGAAMQRRINLVRRLNASSRRHVAILGDLQGHRIRVGDLKAPLDLVKGRTLWLTRDRVDGHGDRVSFDYQGSFAGIPQGQQIFIDDGDICLQVTGRARNSLKTRVVTGGLLKARKGVNIPGARLDFDGISGEDVRDMLFCAQNGTEYIAQSFVRSRKDILDVKDILGGAYKGKIIAKIECREGIRNIDHIIDVSDGIMVARGDMGVSMPIYEIPVLQKMIIKKCNRARKFVITATQMLESMVSNLRPTRAEVADVANAVMDGTDFVMLSAESAVGQYPAQTIAMMHSIIRYTEGYLRK